MKKLSFKPQAIIFDMDGVIVDSMPYHFIAWYEALIPFGIRVNCLDVYLHEGEKLEKSLDFYLRKAGKRLNKDIKDKVVELHKSTFNSVFKRNIYPDVDNVIKCLKDRNYNLALVTGTHSGLIDKILPTHIKKRFNCIITGDLVKNGKPSPEPYLLAAKRLSVKPEFCLVIENAPLGVESAKKAGMFCIALTTSLPKEYLKKADMILDSISELLDILKYNKSC